MKRFPLILLAFAISSSFGQINEIKSTSDKAQEKIKPVSVSEKNISKSLYVNPFIGTGGHGHTFPGASAPFGMIQLSPDTRYDGWEGCSGYHYSDSIIYGFSHTHLSGTGVPDYCDLLIVPQSGVAKIDPGYLTKDGYGSTFLHENEKASPGYYEVKLDQENINVRLTVSERAGFHEYTFNNNDEYKYILIDLDHRDKLLDYSLNIIDKFTVSGSRISESWAKKQQFYFYLKTDIPYEKSELITKNGKHKLLLTFGKEVKKVNVKVGISAVDIDGAKKNLETEIAHWNFDLARASVSKIWNKELDRVYFYSPYTEVMTNFYTALYHSYLAPNVFSDIDGRYRGRDGQTHTLADSTDHQYTVFSLWDTYRATHPLFTLTQQEKTNEFIRTFLRQYEEAGDLPVWELAGNETECMIGYHSVSVIADAYSKGISEFDIHKAMEAMIATSKFDEYGKKEFASKGFIETGDDPESVSKTLEYAYDDFCIYQFLVTAKMKQIPGATDDLINEYHKRSLNFLNVYDPNSKFMRARRSGVWFSPFDPAEVNFNYTEANSWQYSLYAPHAVGVLRDLLGGKDSLEMWLDRLFTTDSNLSGRHQVDITGLIGQYAHGNEPSHHMAYLYNYTNSPEKTQFYVDKILKEMYANAPDGLSGNEDCGQMSSWYVLSALGFYQIAPSLPLFEIGRPMMKNASIEFENGNKLIFNVINNKLENKYIQQIKLNGNVLTRSFLSYQEIMRGGTLEIIMGNTPVKDLFTQHAPTMSIVPDYVVPAPFFEQETSVFEDEITISLSMIPMENVKIHYTTDGSEPTSTSPVYTKSFKINSVTTIKAIAIGPKGKSSVVSNVFTKKDKAIKLELKSEYANQYAAGGYYTLIDGIRGGNEYRTGDWQGYYAKDIVAEITFDSPRKLNEIGIGCLRDMKSWIFFPSEIIVEISFDGVNYSPLEKIVTVKPIENSAPGHMDYLLETKTDKPIKSFRIKVVNYGKCPEWHLGAGNDTWLFVDEIIMH